ncbi:hypothetical protein QMK19_03330 [Streptomyces sp. H10-C2]|uniref:hypothetical protein n=1 Tax=unclassified Streptomyces TaxID=2593676 RepID=UPI0024B8D55F|nr:MULTISPECIES: hypothetical protein [unclassified Streptomyces]MDJ0342218.1 hypothetical protein [Streptomyces sp. PH10-H1]MDJ0368732.1 hypothetical protein [Streptomyces sp. H10-C2]
MTPLDRLLAESIPDGTFGGARTPAARPSAPRRATTALEAAAHYRALEAALDERARPARRHLHAVPNRKAAA